MKGVIYLLTSIETGRGYIGSSINLEQRLRNHKNKSETTRSKLLGPFTHMILDEVIDDDITDKDEFKVKLELVERKWQDLYWGNLVNVNRVQVTPEEIIDRFKKWNEKYKLENIEEKKEYNAGYYAKYSEEYKKRYEENSDKIKESQAEYRKINYEKRREKFNCECGGKYTYTSKSRHFTSQKHLNGTNTLQNH